MRRTLLAFKVVVTVTLLGFVVAAVDVGALGRLLGDASPGYFVAAVGALLVQAIVLAVRFRAIVAGVGRPIGLRFAVELAFVGALFNQALPSAVGGDAIRAWKLQKDGRSWREALATVLLDRGTGVVVLAVLAAVAAVLEPSGALVHTRGLLLVVAAAGLAAVALLAGADLLPVLPQRARRWLSSSGVPAGVRTLLATRLGAAAGAWSAVSHLLAAFAAYLLAFGLGVEIAPGTFFAAALCMLLATMIPLSYAGWGLREAGAVWVFSQVGLAAEHALAISMLFGAALLLAALPGVAFWMAPQTVASVPHRDTPSPAP